MFLRADLLLGGEGRWRLARIRCVLESLEAKVMHHWTMKLFQSTVSPAEWNVEDYNKNGWSRCKKYSPVFREEVRGCGSDVDDRCHDGRIN